MTDEPSASSNPAVAASDANAHHLRARLAMFEASNFAEPCSALLLGLASLLRRIGLISVYSEMARQ
jgi:hypothetical protein